MMSDSMDCYCDMPIMAQIHTITGNALKRHLVPAAICAFVMLACVLGLLSCGAAAWGRATAGEGGDVKCGAGGDGYGGKGYVESSGDAFKGSDQHIVG